MTTTHEAPAPGAIRSLIPARIDRLPWSPFHTRMVIALGVAWILDGLEITVASAVADVLTEPDDAAACPRPRPALIATVYLLGEVVGALFFGRLSDKLGRRKLFIITLAVYLVGSGLTALTLGNGAGLARLPVRHPVHRRHGHRRRVRGDQLRDRRADPRPVPRPGRHRGQRHLLGRRDHRHAGHATSSSTSLSAERRLAARLPARPGAGPGDLWSSAGTCRRARAGRSCTAARQEAEETIDYIEHEVEQRRRELPPVRREQGHRDQADRAHRLPRAGPGAVQGVPEAVGARRDADDHPVVPLQRDLLHLHAGAEATSTASPATTAPLFLIAFAVGNLAGPLTLGHLFDTIGRKKMIAGTYILSGRAAGDHARCCSRPAC